MNEFWGETIKSENNMYSINSITLNITAGQSETDRCHHVGGGGLQGRRVRIKGDRELCVLFSISFCVLFESFYKNGFICFFIP